MWSIERATYAGHVHWLTGAQMLVFFYYIIQRCEVLVKCQTRGHY